MHQDDQDKKYNRSYYLTKKEHEIVQVLIKLMRVAPNIVTVSVEGDNIRNAKSVLEPWFSFLTKTSNRKDDYLW